MDFSRNYYGALGLRDTATQGDIRKAYRSLAVKYHPDKNNDDKRITERFHAIQQAYEILSDPIKKRQYDAVRKQPVYSPYTFGKQVDFGNTDDSKMPNIPLTRKKPKFIWLKPVVLILIALIAVWIMIHLKP